MTKSPSKEAERLADVAAWNAAEQAATQASREFGAAMRDNENVWRSTPIEAPYVLYQEAKARLKEAKATVQSKWMTSK